MPVRPPDARSFVLDLLSTLRRGAMPVRALVASAALFGIAEGSVRVALTRLLASGARRARRVRASTGSAAAAAPVQRRVAAWRELDARLRAVVGRLDRRLRGARRESCRRARRNDTASERCGLSGFRAIRARPRVRPDNLAGGVTRLREELARSGSRPAAVVCELRELDPVSEARARELWDADELVAQLSPPSPALDASARRLRTRSRGSRDGRVVPRGRRGAAPARARSPAARTDRPRRASATALVDAMLDYDAIGRASWSELPGAPRRACRGKSPRQRPSTGTRFARGGLR